MFFLCNKASKHDAGWRKLIEDYTILADFKTGTKSYLKYLNLRENCTRMQVHIIVFYLIINLLLVSNVNDFVVLFMRFLCKLLKVSQVNRPVFLTYSFLGLVFYLVFML